MQVSGSFVTIGGTKYYKISNSEGLKPFFIQVASACDMWIFMSSNGGLTAGRKNAEGNIFPYTTDDKLAMDYETGSKTIIKTQNAVWIPFEQNPKYNISRNIYKSYYANSVIMEEINHDLELSYSYKYESSERFGFIKTSKIANLTGKIAEIQVLDGLMNILPYGVNAEIEANASTLVDAYKVSELHGKKLAIYSLTTTINDTPYPIEMLRANVGYNTLGEADVYLNPDVVDGFLHGDLSEITSECYGKKCGYFVVYDCALGANEQKEYSFVLDNGYDHAKIAEIEDFANGSDFAPLYEDIEKGTDAIIKIVKDADGIQNTGDEVACAAHYLNTLYNVMRGGTFEDGYEFDYNVFEKFVQNRNKDALAKTEILSEIKKCTTVEELKKVTEQDQLMYRLALEYMPLSFSRRHGDPSRPWNKFNIALKDEKGDKTVHYEGNWRDIFQNWEALGLSYPAYYENMVAKFVNASTIDGYNPYRINAEGIDWEKPEPENPFSGLGYWGDHQIVYLLRLLQGLAKHYPNKLSAMLEKDVFTYANVPYKLKNYDDILKDSKNTIDFDFNRDEELEILMGKMGSDAKLVQKDGKVYTVCLAEKLLVPILSKISNLLPGGGVWMNTQRPEWNDANNAIVGIGLSMITVYHMQAYLEYIKEIFADEACEYVISSEVVNWLRAITDAIRECEVCLDEKQLLDKMGRIFSDYRCGVYENGFSSKLKMSGKTILDFISRAISVVEYTIEKNKGDVYVSYNLLKDDFTYTPMKSMLEGQSAIIGSGILSAGEVCALMDAMKVELFREKEKYHTLYPIKMTTRFYDKNRVSDGFEPTEGIIHKDKNGRLHFEPSIVTEDELKTRCEKSGMSGAKTEELVAEFERVFEHKKFNGRSDVMYKFEGIGCVYWHQNAKFALAVLESAQKCRENRGDFNEIYGKYRELLEGFIYRKTPAQCSAIPIEPYSHTSFIGKSEQPGMTGQVKESVIMRRGELGVSVKTGRICFDGAFLDKNEFSEHAEVNFTIYGVDVSYKKSQNKGVSVEFASGKTKILEGYVIDEQISGLVFDRSDDIKCIEVRI